MILSIATKTQASCRRICKVLGYPRSSFYEAASETSRKADDREIADRIEEIFYLNLKCYGYRRISSSLDDQGVECSPARVRKLMKQRGLVALQPRRFKPVTSDGKAEVPAPNLLKDQPLPDKPNAVWTGDITYVKTARGWVYLAVVIDLYSRRIVGWALADHMRASLVSQALENALEIRRPHSELIFHSDRGSQYGSAEFRTILRRSGILQSMSAKANPYDNAWTESFMGTLKLEHVHQTHYENEATARIEIFKYIDGYYNTRRKHSAIGYRSPNQFEQSILTLN